MVIEPKDTNQTIVVENLNQHDLTFCPCEPHTTFSTIAYFEFLEQQKVFTKVLIAFRCAL